MLFDRAVPRLNRFRCSREAQCRKNFRLWDELSQVAADIDTKSADGGPDEGASADELEKYKLGIAFEAYKALCGTAAAAAVVLTAAVRHQTAFCFGDGIVAVHLTQVGCR